MDRVLLRTVTEGEWPVELVESDGLWETRGVQTLIFLPPFLGPAGTLLVHRLAFTYPTPWTTEDLGAQLGLPRRQRLLDALARAADFNIIHIGSLGIQVPDHLGPLPTRLLQQLPDRLQHAHARLRDHQARGAEREM